MKADRRASAAGSRSGALSERGFDPLFRRGAGHYFGKDIQFPGVAGFVERNAEPVLVDKAQVETEFHRSADDFPRRGRALSP